MRAMTFCLFLASSVCSCPSLQGQLAFERDPIRYSQTESQDDVADLFRRLDSGKTQLKFEPSLGYLRSVLKQLDIPSSSQTLVFGKNSLQRHKISPSNPRAIYFNDEIYVGFIPGAEQLEIAAIDDQLGTVFYTIDQTPDADAAQRTRANHSCLFCHASSHTGRVPGLIMQSNWTDPKGYRVFPTSTITPSPTGAMANRWGGWFVTGRHGNQTHLGNVMITNQSADQETSFTRDGNLTDLSKWLDPAKFLAPDSDLVALMVLQHQVTVHNLLTKSNHDTRLLLHQSDLHPSPENRAETDLQIKIIAADLADGLLLVDAIQFSDPVSGTSDFVTQFSRRGPRTVSGKSLRDLDLKRRLFRYSCSFLIYTSAFTELPPPLLQATRSRILSLLGQSHSDAKYAHLDPEARAAILEILRETHPMFRSADTPSPRDSINPGARQRGINPGDDPDGSAN